MEPYIKIRNYYYLHIFLIRWLSIMNLRWGEKGTFQNSILKINVGIWRVRWVSLHHMDLKNSSTWTITQCAACFYVWPNKKNKSQNALCSGVACAHKEKRCEVLKSLTKVRWLYEQVYLVATHRYAFYFGNQCPFNI